MPLKKTKPTPSPLTYDEQEAYELAMESDWPKALAIAAILHNRHPDAKATGAQGVIECPSCGGPLNYSIAKGNGHVWARCTHKGCVSFMQ